MSVGLAFFACGRDASPPLQGSTVEALGGCATGTPAFPNAQGFGACTTGGRSPSAHVYIVDRLSTDRSDGNPLTRHGSLQWALDQPTPSYIVFRVSGLINGPVQIMKPNVTIAGQTSPRGITVRGIHTTEDAPSFAEGYCGEGAGFASCIHAAGVTHSDNVIIRHMRSRPGTTPGGLDDGVRLRALRGVVLDHVSIGSAQDEALQLSFAKNVTISNTMFAETNNTAEHAVRGGLLSNYSSPETQPDGTNFQNTYVTIHHNLWNRILNRFPELAREENPNNTGTTQDYEISYNLFWDPHYTMWISSCIFSSGSCGSTADFAWRINAVNNAFYAQQTGDHTDYAMFCEDGTFAPATQIYFNGNRYYRGSMTTPSDRVDYSLIDCTHDYWSEPTPPNTNPRASSTALPFPAVTPTATSGLRQYMVDNVGAFPRDRDAFDARLLGYVNNGVLNPGCDPWVHCGSGAAADPLATVCPGTGPTASPDTDDDGIPDAWEVATGTNPNDASDATQTRAGEVYPNIELYLNAKADQIESASYVPPACGGTQPVPTPSSSPDYSLTATSPLSITQAGATGTSTVSVNHVAGHAESVTFSVLAPPAGITASVAPSSSTTSTTLTIGASCTAAVGSTNVTVRGTDTSGRVHDVAVAIDVAASSSCGSPPPGCSGSGLLDGTFEACQPASQQNGAITAPWTIVSTGGSGVKVNTDYCTGGTCYYRSATHNAWAGCAFGGVQGIQQRVTGLLANRNYRFSFYARPSANMAHHGQLLVKTTSGAALVGPKTFGAQTGADFNFTADAYGTTPVSGDFCSGSNTSVDVVAQIDCSAAPAIASGGFEMDDFSLALVDSATCGGGGGGGSLPTIQQRGFETTSVANGPAEGFDVMGGNDPDRPWKRVTCDWGCWIETGADSVLDGTQSATVACGDDAGAGDKSLRQRLSVTPGARYTVSALAINGNGRGFIRVLDSTLSPLTPQAGSSAQLSSLDLGEPTTLTEVFDAPASGVVYIEFGESCPSGTTSGSLTTDLWTITSP